MLKPVVLGCLFLLFPVALMATDIDGEVRIGLHPGLDKPASVQLMHEHDVLNEQLTDLQGHFTFQGVQPNLYTIRAVYGDLPEQIVNVDVMNGNMHYKVPITIQPPAHEKTVTVTGITSAAELAIPKAAQQEYAIGLEARKKGDCGKAMPHLQKALDLYTQYGAAFNEMGTCQKAAGETDRAEASFLKAIAYNSTIYPSMNLADLYASTKRYADAESVVRNSLIKNPAEGDLYFELARVQFEQGKLSDAETSGLKAHILTHRTADVHLLMVKIYVAEKNGTAAIDQMKMYVNEHPEGAVADQIRKQLASIKP